MNVREGTKGVPLGVKLVKTQDQVVLSDDILYGGEVVKEVIVKVNKDFLCVVSLFPNEPEWVEVEVVDVFLKFFPSQLLDFACLVFFPLLSYSYCRATSPRKKKGCFSVLSQHSHRKNLHFVIAESRTGNSVWPDSDLSY